MQKLRQLIPYFLAFLCLITGGSRLLDRPNSFGPSSLSKDMVSPWEEHMALVRAALPSDVFVAGYLETADTPNASMPSDNAEFIMTQYGLAPVVLGRGFGQEWLICNFGGTVPLESITPWLDEQLGKYTVQDLGFGIYVIHDIEN